MIGPGLWAPKRAGEEAQTGPGPEGNLSKGERPRVPMIARTPAARSTVPPHTNCSIKTTSRIITSTAMTGLMVLFILTPFSPSTACSIAIPEDSRGSRRCL